MKKSYAQSNGWRVRARVRAAECTPPTRCRRRSRQLDELAVLFNSWPQKTTKNAKARRIGKVLAQAIENNLLPSQILSREAFENAIAVVMATGGSTNAVLHLAGNRSFGES